MQSKNVTIGSKGTPSTHHAHANANAILHMIVTYMHTCWEWDKQGLNEYCLLSTLYNTYKPQHNTKYAAPHTALLTLTINILIKR